MTRLPYSLVLALVFSATPLQAAGLPDTGQVTCYNDTAADVVPASSAASIAGDAGTHPGQDCPYGRDAAAAASALPKIGAGAKGFDYTKVASNGALLAAGAALGTAAIDWACTQDNVTGLTWEVKTAAATDPRYFGHTYTWYDSDASTNGGNAGTVGSNTCNATLPGGLCNTQAFVTAVNIAALCGYSDWRMPTPRELLSLVNADGSNPAVDPAYFPNTAVSTNYWAGSTYVANASSAWAVNFQTGHTPSGSKSSSTRFAVRLVRGAMPGAAFVAGAACAAGNPNGAAQTSTPTSAFTNHGDGTLTHALTGLMWKQCPQGLSGTGCATGSPAAMTWRAALVAAAADSHAGYTDWRLPNAKELASIIEFCGYYPAVNQVVFPGSSVSTFWSGSTSATSPSRAWAVFFYDGGTSSDAKSTSDFVRLVRGGPSSAAIDAQTVKPGVVEYLNTADFPDSPGGHFFYSSEAAEQAAVDSGAAGQFLRTGRLFLTGGTQPVCRFYGSMTPGPNSHFFTVEAGECNALIAAQVTPRPTDVQQWNYEGLSYSTTPATVAANGLRSCPANTLPLYRAYNNAFPPSGPKNPWDSNHRFTPALSDIAAMVASGWRDEGIVFCTAQ